ncbi:hypothetical protein EDF58_101578 [Novosphingobium sp. PhB57]|jgi:hypothetical protein|uniref:hypothetical protein n=1 Tax=unclassified Novosphingobium TaxID=2644732 RepID=UPI001044375D|nr:MULTISPECIES: hypothetical protein [unclassified Novosphingobium]TCU61265.1 hypothetical protein EDF58_101578 [Novosphingobium sp. PhB57]TDW68345.1 hypothetical protein EDF57_101223 [Novosphingobium sp. PhB55]
MRTLASLVAAAALVAGLSAPAQAAAPKKAPAKAAAPAPAAGAHAPSPEVESAMLYLKVLISGLQSDKVEPPVKGALVGCIYNNSLQKISESMDKVIAENAGKIHRDNPSELLSAMVAICGYKPTAAAGAAPQQPAPQGR